MKKKVIKKILSVFFVLFLVLSIFTIITSADDDTEYKLTDYDYGKYRMFFDRITVCINSSSSDDWKSPISSTSSSSPYFGDFSDIFEWPEPENVFVKKIRLSGWFLTDGGVKNYVVSITDSSREEREYYAHNYYPEAQISSGINSVAVNDGYVDYAHNAQFDLDVDLRDYLDKTINVAVYAYTNKGERVLILNISNINVNSYLMSLDDPLYGSCRYCNKNTSYIVATSVEHNICKKIDSCDNCVNETVKVDNHEWASLDEFGSDVYCLNCFCDYRQDECLISNTIYNTIDGYCVKSYNCTVCGDKNEAHVSVWENGFCTICGDYCAHSTFTNGFCDVCGNPCAHYYINGESVCVSCGLNCTHSFVNGYCEWCEIQCEHSFVDSVCEICGWDCIHSYDNHICLFCDYECQTYTEIVIVSDLAVCYKELTYCDCREINEVVEFNEHNFINGVCDKCSVSCIHTFDKNGECFFCGSLCTHFFVNDVCKWCELQCEHNYVDSVCTICGFSCIHSYDNGTCLFCGFECIHNYIYFKSDYVGEADVCAYNVKECKICGDRHQEPIQHSLINGVCSKCKYDVNSDCIHHFIVDYEMVGTTDVCKYKTQECIYCGKLLRTKFEHNLYNNVSCVDCGYCKHDYVFEKNIIVEDDRNVCYIKIYKCSNCEDIYDTEIKHDYEDGECVSCGRLSVMKTITSNIDPRYIAVGSMVLISFLLLVIVLVPRRRRR